MVLKWVQKHEAVERFHLAKVRGHLWAGLGTVVNRSVYSSEP